MTGIGRLSSVDALTDAAGVCDPQALETWCKTIYK